MSNVKITMEDLSQETDAQQLANSKLDGSVHFTLIPLPLLSLSLFVKEIAWMGLFKLMKFVMTEFQLTASDANRTVQETFLGMFVQLVLRQLQVFALGCAEITLLFQEKLAKIMTVVHLEEMAVM